MPPSLDVASQLSVTREDSRSVRTIEPERLLQELQSGRRITLLDVRDPQEIRGLTGCIPGARSLPLNELVTQRALPFCHPSEPIVVISGHGIRSRSASAELEALGFTGVRSLEGGTSRWLELGLSVEREAPSSGRF